MPTTPPAPTSCPRPRSTSSSRRRTSRRCASSSPPSRSRRPTKPPTPEPPSPRLTPEPAPTRSPRPDDDAAPGRRHLRPHPGRPGRRGGQGAAGAGRDVAGRDWRRPTARRPTAPPPTVTEEDPADAPARRSATTELEPLQAQLAKRLKRAMQDEQNDVLDRLRVHKGRPGLGDVLPDAGAQGGRYRDLALPLLEQAAQRRRGGRGRRRGRRRPRRPRRRAGRRRHRPAAQPPGRHLRGRGARGRRRRRPHRAGRCRVPRVEDAAHRAAGRPTTSSPPTPWAASRPRPAGTPLRWVVHDVDGPCPDCDDNALAGPTPRGEAFPTGQLHPPAHAGCRCLLVTSPAVTT